MEERKLQCGRCKTVLPSREFYIRDGRPETSWCKGCYREWHLGRYQPQVPVPEQQECRVCGVAYTPKLRKLTKFCSQYCRNQARIKNDREARLARLADRKCGHCGQAIDVSADSRRHYCDARCAQRARYDRMEPGHRARYNMKRSYGITIAERAALIAKQGGGCAICRTDTPGANGWTIDHDHACCPGDKTCGGCLRGILCQRCNMGIGLLGDDPDRLRAAARYVSRKRS